MNTEQLIARLKAQTGPERTEMLKVFKLPIHVLDDIMIGAKVEGAVLHKVADWLMGAYVRDHVSGEWRLHKLSKGALQPAMVRTKPYTPPEAFRQLDAYSGNPGLGCQPAPKVNKRKPKLGLFGRSGKATSLNIPVNPSQ